MKLEQQTLPVNNHLLSEYWSGNDKLHTFFEYELKNESFLKRADYLKSMSYNSKELSRIVRTFMEPFGLSEKANEHLAYLADGSLVIVGGQQAGLLTGPLYSVHKAISVILLAKEQSEKLGEKVVPLFWIAGEDHDIEEINHTYTIVDAQPKKRVYRERSPYKKMATVTELNKEELKQIIDTIFRDFGETEYSQELYQSVLNSLHFSKTYTDFFAKLMNSLFYNEGLLMVDAAYEPFRKFEADYFTRLIENNKAIAEVVVKKEQLLNEAGFGTPIGATIESANLFYVRDGERLLLERKDELFVNDNANIKLTKEELLNVAKRTPEQLSNNVVTRPLMQEMTIPVLAFVGGPGELAYWGTLKDAFNVLDLQMPIFVPRLNMTIISRQVEQLLNEYNLSVEDVMSGKSKQLKLEFMESVQDEVAKEQITKLSKLIDEQYSQLHAHLGKQQLHLDDILEKNRKYHQHQLEYLSNKIEQTVYSKHDKVIRQFNTLTSEIVPYDNFQERVYNPYQYINLYGPSFISDLVSLPFKFSNRHYIVRM
nr:bacillithiol biosynthesis cysteine-adding enzyme BshC [Lysinibacillus timonensis]